MNITQCVSLDCYRQSRYLGLLSLPELLREIASVEGVTGIDASTESLLPDYPNVEQEFLEQWHKLLLLHGLTPVTLSSYTDRLQFRSHAMDVGETADSIMRDLYIARQLGFHNLRIMHDLPLAAVELALPLAADLNICMLDELMPPGTILPQEGRKGMDCANDLALIRRTGTGHFGLVVNTGLFQTQPNPTQLTDVLLKQYSVSESEKRCAHIMEQFSMLDFSAFEQWMQSNYPELTKNRELFCRMFGVRLFGGSVQPQELKEILPHIRDVYVKYIKLYPDASDPGYFCEPSTPDSAVIQTLSENGYRGPLTSLRMNIPGLSLGTSRPEADIANEERTEVRRHQAHLRRLLR